MNAEQVCIWRFFTIIEYGLNLIISERGTKKIVILITNRLEDHS